MVRRPQGPSSMSAFGENLRREREMRGVSLEEISSATKISIRFLEAIEREDFSKLPGGIFSRSFIRSYARYLGLDEERVVAEYQLAAHPQVDFDLHRMPAGSARAGRPSSRTPLIATLVAVVLLAGGYVLFRYSRRAAEAPAPPPPVPVATPKPSAPPVVPAPTTPGEATAVPSASSPAGQVTPGAAPSTAPSTPPSTAATSQPPGGPCHRCNPRNPVQPAQREIRPERSPLPMRIWCCKWRRRNAPGWPWMRTGRRCSSAC